MSFTADWFEAISTMVAALFAIIGTIIAWNTYRRDRKEQNTKIDNLALLVTKQDSLIEIQEKILIQQQIERQSDVRPLFAQNHFKPFNGSQGVYVKLQNIGKRAFRVRGIDLKDDENDFELDSTEMSIVESAEIVEILVKKITEVYLGRPFSFILKYYDTDNNEYTQKVYWENFRVRIDMQENLSN